MERGTEWERAAVRARWVDLERQRRAATRLLGSVTLALAGVLLALLGIATEACVRVGAVTHGCTAVTPGARAPLLVLLGGIALAGGVWSGRAALRA